MNDQTEESIKRQAEVEAVFEEEAVFEVEEHRPPVPSQIAADARNNIAARCKAAGLPIEDVAWLNDAASFRVGLKCGRGS